MPLFRALSTSSSRRGGYDKLLDESTDDSAPYRPSNQDRAILKRVTSVPARMLFGSSSKKVNTQQGSPANNSKAKQKEKKSSKNNIIHPLFSLFEGKSKKKKKMTANPDFSRYIEYLREGGMWNKDINSPVIYNK